MKEMNGVSTVFERAWLQPCRRKPDMSWAPASGGGLLHQSTLEADIAKRPYLQRPALNVIGYANWAPSKVKHHSSTQAKIVLVVGGRIVKSGCQVIGFNHAQRKTSFDVEIKSSADAARERGTRILGCRI
jgi:hypothetical protein